jgi:hypothetical protein
VPGRIERYLAELRAITRFGSPERVAAAWAEVDREETRGGGMAQKFTETARQAVFFAQEEAARSGFNEVRTEHLMLGLVRESESAAVQVLDRLQVARGRIRAGIERHMTRGPGRIRGQDMQLTPQARAATDLAHEEARALGGEQIGAQHLLLGLLRQAEEQERVEQVNGVIPGSEAVEAVPADRSGAVLLALGIDRQRARAVLAGLPMES